MSDIEIEVSTDSIAAVRTALGEGVEIEESPQSETGGEEQSESGETQSTGEETAPEAEGEEAKAKGEAESEAEGEAEEAEAEKTESTEKAAATKEKSKAQQTVPVARLHVEVAKRKEAERRLEALRTTKQDIKAESETVEKKTAEPQFFSGESEPTLEQFTKDLDQFDSKAMAEATAKYARAFATWSRKEATAEADYRQRLRDAEIQREAVVGPFRKRETAFAKAEPDYREITNNSEVVVSPRMEEFIYDSEVGPQILFHFATNPEEAERFMSMKPVAQSAAMIELAKEFKSPTKAADEEPEVTETGRPGKTIPPKKPAVKPKTTSSAPPPVARVKTGGTTPKSLEDLAGPRDREGVDIEFNPEYERAVKAGRRT